MIRISRQDARGRLVARQYGGCVGMIGAAFTLWMSFLGGIFVWVAAERSLVFFLSAAVVGLMILAGLAVATYRESFLFDRRARSVTRTRWLFLIRISHTRWLMDEIASIEVYRQERSRRTGSASPMYLIALSENEAGPPDQGRVFGASHSKGEAGKVAKQVASFCELPVRDRSAPIP